MNNFLEVSPQKAMQTKAPATQVPWNILVVDNDESIHDVTALVLNDIQFEQRPLKLSHAFSTEQAKTQLSQADHYCVILLDVAIETCHSGLELVNYIRHELNNRFLRIILRTGRPNPTPDLRVMTDYDINGYWDKSDLTSVKMRNGVIAALRSFKDLNTIHELALSQELLNQKVQAHNQELQQINEKLKAEINFRETVERELYYSNNKLKSIINNAEAIISLKTPDGRYDMVNDAFIKNLKVKRTNIIGSTDEQLFTKDVSLAIEYSDNEVLNSQRPMKFEELLPTHLGEHFHLCVKFPLFDENRKVYRLCSICTDIKDRLDAQNELLRLAQYDALTDLPNRTLFIDRLTQVVSRTHWRNKHAAILFIDLDRFKQINDTLGHQMGDKLLVEVARRLKHSTRTGDTVSRLGGDEFAVLLTDMASDKDIIRVIDKIRHALSERYTLEGRELIVTPSIGISRCPIDSTDVELLMKKADTAMYKAKKAGRNTYRFYLKEDDEKACEQLSLEIDIRNMVSDMDKQLFLLYQPKVNLADGTIAGFEALLRWHHPKRGLVSPVEFIPVLEQTGLIINVGNWVLHQACLWASRSAAQGMTAKVSVNLSSRQFKQENLLQTIRQTLADNHCQPDWLELELTEGALVDDLDRTRKVLNQLAEMGVSLAIDDFGTGYSSLNYLKWLPFNTLKIDKSFIKHAPQIKQEKAIVMTIAQLASNLGMQVVAEGVETDCQYHMLKDLAQHDLDIQIQGFIFSQPLPEKQLASCIEHVAKRWHEVDCA